MSAKRLDNGIHGRIEAIGAYRGLPRNLWRIGRFAAEPIGSNREVPTRLIATQPKVGSKCFSRCAVR